MDAGVAVDRSVGPVTPPRAEPRGGDDGARTPVAHAGVAVNGRFRHLEAGGYRRYADELVAHLDGPVVVEPTARNARGVRGRTWEQAVLARRTHDRVLISPAGSGPLRHPRHVVVVHDLLPLERPEWFSPAARRWQQRFLPALLRRASRVVVPSADVADRLHRWVPDASPHTTIIRPAVGHPFGSPVAAGRHRRLCHRLGLAADQPLIGGLVAASHRKNSAQLLSVLAEVGRRTGAAVAVAGHGDEPRVVAGRPRPAHPQVIDLGPLDDDDLAAFYDRMSVFVSLSLGEGFGMPIVEAAACGAAVVTSPVPAARETLAGHVRVVDPSRLDDAVDAVIEALADTDTDTRCAAARRRTWSDVGVRFATIVEELDHRC